MCSTQDGDVRTSARVPNCPHIQAHMFAPARSSPKRRLTCGHLRVWKCSCRTFLSPLTVFAGSLPKRRFTGRQLYCFRHRNQHRQVVSKSHGCKSQSHARFLPQPSSHIAATQPLITDFSCVNYGYNRHSKLAFPFWSSSRMSGRAVSSA